MNNKTEYDFSPDDFQHVVSTTLEMSDCKSIGNEMVSISFALVSQEEIQGINRSYRDKDSATDVLSFAEYAVKDELHDSLMQNKPLFLGEIILCPSYIERCSMEEGLNFPKEFYEAVSHGVLHLLGYEHGSNMFDIQKKIASVMIANK